MNIRSQFPSLAAPTIFLDNAGGSQLPIQAIRSVERYYRESFVQTGADYAPSQAAKKNVALAREFVATFLNARDSGEIILGPSTTALAHIMANTYGDAKDQGTLPEGRDEIIISTAGHEGNIWPWARLESRGFKVTLWHPRKDARGEWGLDLEGLRTLISSRTLLVAFAQVSNILGDVWDARAVCAIAREHGARSVVDGVAYAPHRLPDVQEIGCDWYVYSTYKVFGPHAAAIFGHHEALAQLTGPNHYFIPRDAGPYKYELGGANHESCAMIRGGYEYLGYLAGVATTTQGPFDRPTFTRAFAAIEAIENDLQLRFFEGAAQVPGLRFIGPGHGNPSRVCTISFVIQDRASREIVQKLNAQGWGCRYGNFYSRRLIETLGLSPDDGVIRVSLAHYNTREEVDGFVDALRGCV